ACLCHPDGQIAIFNDSAFSIYNNPEDLLGPESTTDSGPWALPDAGYYGYRSDDDSYIVCDAGPIGPDYIPGHAHGDIFSFELSLKGQRVIVDSGVFSYVAGEMRKYCRSTRAHNTVEINGQDQCEFWSAFRVAKRGYPRDIVWKPASDKFYLNAWHDGYKRLPGNPIHKRQVEWCDSSTITVLDKITATKPVRAISRLHLHPHCVIQEITKKQITIRYPAGIFTIETNGECTFKRERTWYCSEFGNRVKNECLCLESAGSDLLFGYKIAIVG
ncbi:heparinase II/III-family protein, partial [Candidatus Pacearchaeota archaeon]|nr:heparinase II/III-family protein [Candidatus Pacearchaeota archaeon]